MKNDVLAGGGVGPCECVMKRNLIEFFFDIYPAD